MTSHFPQLIISTQQTDENEFFPPDFQATTHSPAQTPTLSPFDDKENYETCPNCSRKFFYGRLNPHMKSCTAAKPFKPLKPLKEKKDDNPIKPSLKKSLSSNFSYKVKASEEKVDTLEEIVDNAKMNEMNETFQLGDKGEKETVSEDKGEIGGKRVKCSVCCRKFDEDRIEKHENACQNAHKKRPLFNSSLKRTGEEKENVASLKKNKALNKTEKMKQNTQEHGQNSKEKWRVEHENFIKSIRRNRMLIKEGEKGETMIEHPEYIFCQYCKRRFAPKIAERHIPNCKNIFHRPKPPSIALLDINNNNQTKSEVNILKQTEIMTKYTTYYKNDLIFEEDEDKYPNHSQNNAKKEKIFKGIPIKLPEICRVNASSLEREPNLQTIYDRESSLERKINMFKDANKSKGRVLTKKEMLACYKDLITRSAQYSTIVCPHCERKFDPRASERHIPICKNLLNRGKCLSETIKNFLVKKDEKKSLGYIEPCIENLRVGRVDLNLNERHLGKILLIKGKDIIKKETPMIVKQILEHPTSLNLNAKKLSEFSLNEMKSCQRCRFRFNLGNKYCGNCGLKRVL